MLDAPVEPHGAPPKTASATGAETENKVCPLAKDKPNERAESSFDVPLPSIPWRPIAVVLAVVMGLLGWGAWKQYGTSVQASQTAQATGDFVPTVQVARVRREDAPATSSLPGTVNAFDQATIYARSTGYIAERRVDIGTRVKQGDLLAVVSAPDLDQQLAQANAQLVQTQAALLQAGAQARNAASSATLADATNRRTATLAADGWETRQNADNTRLGLAGSRSSEEAALAAVKVAQANLAAQSAAVSRLVQLKEYENVTAPFDGVITTRNVDTGDLVSADTNGVGNTLFTIVRDSIVRVQVDVPQSGAVGVRDGLDAVVHLAELPGTEFRGKIARTAVALVQASRTMQIEVDVENAGGELHPGSYVTVDFGIPRSTPGIVVPAEAIMFNGQGLRVAVLKDGNVVHLQDVAIYRDYGTSVELRSGLVGGELVVMNLPVTVGEGGKVKPATEGATEVAR